MRSTFCRKSSIDWVYISTFIMLIAAPIFCSLSQVYAAAMVPYRKHQERLNSNRWDALDKGSFFSGDEAVQTDTLPQTTLDDLQVHSNLENAYSRHVRGKFARKMLSWRLSNPMLEAKAVNTRLQAIQVLRDNPVTTDHIESLLIDFYSAYHKLPKYFLPTLSHKNGFCSLFQIAESSVVWNYGLRAALAGGLMLAPAFGTFLALGAFAGQGDKADQATFDRERIFLLKNTLEATEKLSSFIVTDNFVKGMTSENGYLQDISITIQLNFSHGSDSKLFKIKEELKKWRKNRIGGYVREKAYDETKLAIRELIAKVSDEADPAVPATLGAISELDLLISQVRLMENHPTMILPTVEDVVDEARIDIEDGHLITYFIQAQEQKDSSLSVPNSISLKKKVLDKPFSEKESVNLAKVFHRKDLALKLPKRILKDFVTGSVVGLSGSNTNGKSSVLRLVPTLISTAQSALPVPAKKYTATITRPRTSILSGDVVGKRSLSEDQARIAGFIDEVTKKSKIPVAYFLDEIFNGTGPSAKRMGIMNYLAALAGRNTMGIVASNDFSLIRDLVLRCGLTPKEVSADRKMIDSIAKSNHFSKVMLKYAKSNELKAICKAFPID